MRLCNFNQRIFYALVRFYVLPYSRRMNQLRQNLAYLFERNGTNAAAVARATGVSQPTIHRIMTGGHKDPRMNTLQPLADHFGVTLDFLLHTNAQAFYESSGLGEANTHEGPKIRGLVPCLTSVQAGEWREISGSFQAEDAKVWLPCPVKHGPQTFCLVVDGESMRNPGGRPSYEPGDIIFVDPDVGVTSGDRVVVQLDSQVAATFKQYVEEDGRKMLKALNPEWTPRYLEINGNATICGVVIGKWVPE